MLHPKERAQELTEYIDVLIQQFVEVQQNLNETYHSVSKQEINIISIVGKAGECIMREIAERSHLAVSSVTPIVDKLVEKKLVKRERSEEDRRIVSVRLTEKGARIYQVEVESYMRLAEMMLSALTTKEQDTFLSLFQKIVTTIQISAKESTEADS